VTVSRLVLVKALHTAIWALLAACVVAIPIAAWLGWFGAALGLIGVVAVEVAVLALNAWQCPLRGVAGRYTADRRDGFDIFLPPWLARNTMPIFGPLFAGGLLATGVLWWLRRG
jgi:hypothetical protein